LEPRKIISTTNLRQITIHADKREGGIVKTAIKKAGAEGGGGDNKNKQLDSGALWPNGGPRHGSSGKRLTAIYRKGGGYTEKSRKHHSLN